jgi:hypothetical protein
MCTRRSLLLRSESRAATEERPKAQYPQSSLHRIEMEQLETSALAIRSGGHGSHKLATALLTSR